MVYLPVGRVVQVAILGVQSLARTFLHAYQAALISRGHLTENQMMLRQLRDGDEEEYQAFLTRITQKYGPIPDPANFWEETRRLYPSMFIPLYNPPFNPLRTGLTRRKMRKGRKPGRHAPSGSLKWYLKQVFIYADKASQEAIKAQQRAPGGSSAKTAEQQQETEAQQVAKGHPMSPLDAKQILNLSEPITPENVDAKAQMLLNVNDPAKGGSQYLREKIEAARAVILDDIMMGGKKPKAPEK